MPYLQNDVIIFNKLCFVIKLDIKLVNERNSILIISEEMISEEHSA